MGGVVWVGAVADHGAALVSRLGLCEWQKGKPSSQG